MLINLSTLDVHPDIPAQVVQAWSPEFGAWVCIVEHKSPEPPPQTIELTREDIRRMVDLRSQGLSKGQILQTLGIRRASPDPGL